MPPKGKKGGGAKDKAGDEREDILQAVLFADSFETRFHPFTLERPRCLMPLANTPLIEYTLEFLASAGVEEVYLYCGNHTDVVEEYLSRSKWTQNTAPFSLEIIRSDSRSVGDCMRDLDQKQLIVGDFICVYGDVVANISLEHALAAHRARRTKDKKSIMTMVLREVGTHHRTKSAPVRTVFVLDPATERCVHYEQIPPGQRATLDIPGEVLKDHVEVEIREDLVDCGIDICTPEVLAQYTDNFDWQLPRRGFLRGVLKDFETFQLMIHTHVTSQGYAARVKNLRAYDAISKDVVSRWTYPFTPDANLMDDQTYRLQKNNVHREDGVTLARSSKVGARSMLGSGTVVGKQTTITNSVIGRRCIIGHDCQIDGAYIWDDTHIGHGTTIEKAMIANEVRVGARCRVEQNALISHGVALAEGTIVPSGRRLTKHKRGKSSGADEASQSHTDPKVVGEDGIGYHLELDEEEEEVVEALLCDTQKTDFALAADDVSTFSDDSAADDDDDEDSDGLSAHIPRGSIRSGSFASIGSDESGETRHGASDFYHEAQASIFDALQKAERPDDMQLELRALTLAANADGKLVRRAIAVAYAKRIASLIESSSPASPKDAVAAVIPPYQLLIRANVKEEHEQAEFLLYLQTDLVHRPQGDKVLLFASNALATLDLCEAEGFEAWWNDPRSSATPALLAVRKDTAQLVEVLVGDDDDDEDEDEEDDDEDEED